MIFKRTFKTVLPTLVTGLTLVPNGVAQSSRIAAQWVVDKVKNAHREITGLEIAATKPGTHSCKTIAATEAKEIGQKCDKDELTAMRINQPFAEKEKTEFDVTLPLHDTNGKVIATAGMDFKIEGGRTKETAVKEAVKIAAEMERRLPSLEEMFRPALRP